MAWHLLKSDKGYHDEKIYSSRVFLILHQRHSFWSIWNCSSIWKWNSVVVQPFGFRALNRCFSIRRAKRHCMLAWTFATFRWEKESKKNCLPFPSLYFLFLVKESYQFFFFFMKSYNRKTKERWTIFSLIYIRAVQDIKQVSQYRESRN